MSRKATGQELAVNERFDRFVAEHVARGAFWFVVGKDGEEPGTFIHHVEFDTDEHHRPNPGSEGQAFLYMMDIITVETLDPNTDSVTLKHSGGRHIGVSDPKNELNILVGVPTPKRKSGWTPSVASLMDHLVELEDAGHFVPASQRYRDLRPLT